MQKTNDNKIRNTFLINATLLVIFFLTLFLITGGNILKLNLTGFTFAEFYDTEVMYTLNAVSGEETTFVVPVQNSQEKTIEGIYAEIEILSPDQEVIKKLKTEKINISPNTETELTVKWENDLYPGTYQARIYIASDDTDATFTKTFKIEQKTITIESVLVNNFELGEIVNLEVLVQNHLNKDIKNTRANLLVYDESENIITNINSPTITLNKTTLNKLETSWNTKDITPGKYNAKLQVEGEEYTIEKDLVFTIDQNTMSVSGVGFAINYKQQNSADTMWRILIERIRRRL